MCLSDAKNSDVEHVVTDGFQIIASNVQLHERVKGDRFLVKEENRETSFD